MGDVSREAALALRRLVQLVDQFLELVGHVVERRSEGAELVPRRGLQPRVQVPAGDRLGSFGGGGDGAQRLPSDDLADGTGQHDRHRPSGGGDSAELAEALTQLLEREEEVVPRSGGALGGDDERVTSVDHVLDDGRFLVDVPGDERRRYVGEVAARRRREGPASLRRDHVGLTALLVRLAEPGEAFVVQVAGRKGEGDARLTQAGGAEVAPPVLPRQDERHHGDHAGAHRRDDQEGGREPAPEPVRRPVIHARTDTRHRAPS